jgi:hypothetical protein
VILGIGLVVRIPDRFVAEHDLAIDDGRHLAVAAAEVKADTAPLEMPAERLRL